MHRLVLRWFESLRFAGFNRRGVKGFARARFDSALRGTFVGRLRRINDVIHVRRSRRGPNFPNIYGAFQFHGDLEEIANRMVPLPPSETSAEWIDGAAPGRARRQFQRDPRISWEVSGG